MLALLSAKSLLSDICRGEHLRALRKGRCVIPLIAKRGGDRPVYLEASQYLDFSPSAEYPDLYRRLVAEIRNRRGVRLTRGYEETRYKTVPPLPLTYIERSDIRCRLRNELVADQTSREIAVTGVRGMGGIGKTVLVQALCHNDEVIHASFPDGIAWIPIGQNPGNLVQQMRDVADALGESTAGFDSQEQSIKRIREILGSKAALVVLDDVWDARHVEPFRVEGSRCRILFTTRDARIPNVIGARDFPVDVMTLEDALRLLSQCTAIAMTDLPPQAIDVVKECGQLPIAIAMAGSLIRGGAKRWERVLSELQLAKLGHIASTLPHYPYSDISAVIDVSLNALEAGVAARFCELGVFPADLPIPEGALESLWHYDINQCRQISDRPTDASLATQDQGGRLILHDLHREYACSRLGDGCLLEAHEKLLRGYEAKCNGIWGAGPDDGYFFAYLTYHLVRAGRRHELAPLLVDLDWMQARLLATRPQGLMQDYEFVAGNAELELIQDAISLSAHILQPCPAQLAEQLIVRLEGINSEVIRNLLSEARRRKRGLWIEPLWSTLPHPGGPLRRTLELDQTVYSVAVAPDGSLAAASCGDGLRLWDLRSGQELPRLAVGSGYVSDMAVSSQGRRCVIASSKAGIVVWDLRTRRELLHVASGGVPSALSIAPRGDLVAAATDGGDLLVWDCVSTKQIHRLKMREDSIYSVAITSDSRHVIYAAGGHVQVRAVRNGRVATFRRHRAEVTSLSVTVDCAHVISGASDGTVRIWELETGKECACLDASKFDREYPAAPVVAVAADLSLRHVTTTTCDGAITIWDVQSGQPIRTWRWHVHEEEGVFDRIAITPDGRYAVSASDTQTVQVWHLERRHLQSLKKLATELVRQGYMGVLANIISTEDKEFGLDRF